MAILDFANLLGSCCKLALSCRDHVSGLCQECVSFAIVERIPDRLGRRVHPIDGQPNQRFWIVSDVQKSVLLLKVEQVEPVNDFVKRRLELEGQDI